MGEIRVAPRRRSFGRCFLRRFRLLRGFASRGQGVSGMISGCVIPSCTSICWVWSPLGK
jgi:hypothetical protein